MSEPAISVVRRVFCFLRSDNTLVCSNRLMHAAGTTLGIATAIAAFVMGHPWFALLWIPVAYGFAWTGHFLLEKNTPATFGHPFLVIHQ